MKFIRMSEDGKAGIFEIEEDDGILLIENEDGEIIYATQELKQTIEALVRDLVKRLNK